MSETLASRLRASATTVGPAGRRVLAYIEREPMAVLASSAVELAAEAKTSDATVVRTVQSLGFTGLPQLKRALLDEIAASPSAATDMRRTLADLGSCREAIEDVIRAHEEGLVQLRDPATRATLLDAAMLLSRAARIVVFGIGPSAAIATYAATLLNRTGRASRTLDCTGAMLADQLLDLRAGDGLLCFSYGQSYVEIEVVLAEARRLDLPVVLVTDNGASEVAGHARSVIALPRGRPGHFALHGLTVVALEAMILSLATNAAGRALATLDRLNDLRGALRRKGRTPAAGG